MKTRIVVFLLLSILFTSCKAWKSIGCEDCKVVYGKIEKRAPDDLIEDFEVTLDWHSEHAGGNGFAIFSSSLFQHIDKAYIDKNGNYLIIFHPTKNMIGGKYLIKVTDTVGQSYAKRVIYTDDRMYQINLELKEETEYPY